VRFACRRAVLSQLVGVVVSSVEPDINLFLLCTMEKGVLCFTICCKCFSSSLGIQVLVSWPFHELAETNVSAERSLEGIVPGGRRFTYCSEIT
jgi:hypothetical protein